MGARRGTVLGAVVLAAAAVALAQGQGVGESGWHQPDEPAVVGVQRSDASQPGEPLEVLLDQVEVLASRPSVPGYERDCGDGQGCVFGQRWNDAHTGLGGRNGCDTRIICIAQASGS